jgi:hypothetical protein
MKASWKNIGVAMVAGILTATVIMFCSSNPRAMARAEHDGTNTAHYSVVMTEGHNLLVADNASNNLYFYTIDKDKPIGSPLKLRASIDLTKVGQPEIEITKHNMETK